jgi:hypothetical protein
MTGVVLAATVAVIPVAGLVVAGAGVAVVVGDTGAI